MLMVQTSLDKIRNAIARLDHYEELSDDCTLFVQTHDGSFAELLANSEETGSKETEQLCLGHLRDLFPKDGGKDWQKAWDRLDNDSDDDDAQKEPS